MANIHLNRNRQSLGHFPPEEVASGLQSGRFLPTDLGWTEGMASWKPLSEFTDLPLVEAPTPTIAPGIELAPTGLVEIQPAWERRPEVGFFQAILESIRDLVANPGKVFRALPSDNHLFNPLSFLVLMAGACLAVFLTSNLLISLVNPAFLSSAGGSVAMLIFSTVLSYGLVLFATVVLTFLTAVIFHVILQVMGGANQSFVTTFRVVCYSTGVALMLALIPMCGLYLVPMYQFILCIVGLQQAHRTEGWKATLTVVLPAVLCCGVAIVAVAVLLNSLSGTEFWQEFLKEFEKQRR